jgi:acetyl esterase/lipase
MWIAIPSSQWTLTTYSLPVSRRTPTVCHASLDDSVRLADRLNDAEVPNRLSIYPGALHSFLQLAGHLDAADHAIGEIATGLREVLLAPQWPQRQVKRQRQHARR